MFSNVEISRIIEYNYLQICIHVTVIPNSMGGYYISFGFCFMMCKMRYLQYFS